MKKLAIFMFAMLVSILSNFAQEIDNLSWPREFEKNDYQITIYQPQIESFEKNVLEGRMAISIKPKDKDLIFCAAWFKATISTDTDERTAALEKIQIVKLNFPDMDDEKQIEKFSRMLESEIESWDVEMSLDRLSASLGDVEDLKTQTVTIKNDPPDIYFRTTPSLLISIDGDPIVKEIENSGLEYVVNTAFFIVREKGKSVYYIKGGKFWYQSNDILTGWKETSKVPSDIEKLAKDNLKESEPDSISLSITDAPSIIVVTKPSELIETSGDPDYKTIENTALLYVDNSESDIIMDINSQEHYLLLAGRWFHSKTLKDGDWKFAEPNKLPKDFLNIPDSSDVGDVRASIPGTPESQDALLDQSIPQTAAVYRDSASVEVKYDGDPEFKNVDGTDISYAINTDKQVLKINNKFYCVNDGIWFVSSKATGPWAVSDTRPNEVDDLPANSEVYNVKYVYVYDSTPEVVYVGYYPGYTYSYVYGGVVVYGTGYWYNPWYRYYYYPRPVTYGYGVHWNPWTGWGFTVGFSYGWVGWGFHPYPGWWGPRGYYPGYRHGYHAGYHHGYRRGAYAGYRAGYNAGQRNAYRNNVYKNRTRGVTSTARQHAQNRPATNRMARTSTKPNNMYTDRSGNVHQRNNDGSWSQKSNKKVVQPSTRESIAKPNNGKTNVNRKETSSRLNRPAQNKSTTQQQLNRSAQNRNRGNQNFNSARSGASRNSGARAGGGRRR